MNEIKKLIDLVNKSDTEMWLMEQVMKYAIETGYSAYTSTLVEAWRISIQGLSKALTDAFEVFGDIHILGPDEDIKNDPVAAFGVLEAELHRKRGISLRMFLGCYKLYIRTYQDLVYKSGFDKSSEQKCIHFVNRVFERIEIAYVDAWSSLSEDYIHKELQDANRQITNEKNWFLTIVESLPNPVLLLDLENEIEYLNTAAARMLNVSDISGGAYYNREDLNVKLPHWLENQLQNFVLSGSEQDSFEVTLGENEAGDSFLIHLHKMMDVSEKFTGTVTIFHDITHRKRYELNLRQAKEAAESANRAKSEFLANMSHEIRTPMNAVLGFSEVLGDLEIDPEKLHYLNNIRTSGKSLLNLINQILDFSKIEAGRMELQYSAVSVPALFREMNTIFGRKIAAKGLVFELTCDSSVPAVLILDEIRLRQVLMNLIGNAVKFTDTGKICLRATAMKSDSSSQNRVALTIEVEDTGIGVPDSQKENIFKAFERIEDEKTAVSGGTGLGLTIVHRLVTMMQGEIGVQGEEGHGAIFRIRLPNVEIAALESLNVAEDDTLDLQTVSFEPASILIADDVDYNREILTVFLASFNFSFLYAANGLAAVEQARKHHPDIILMDMKMPEMNGYEASKILKADEALKTIPIIAVTASALSQDEATIADLCDGYMRKPVSRVDMVRQLMRYLPHGVGKAEPGPIEKAVEGPMVIPSGEDMKKLYHLAMMGDMSELSQFAQTLIVIDESLGPFVRKLQQMAARFQDSEILILLRESMEDAV